MELNSLGVLHAAGDCPGQALLVQMGGSEDTERLIFHMKFGVLWFGSTVPGCAVASAWDVVLSSRKGGKGLEGRSILVL